ncbi:MAG TPA: DUF1127 domain-containing protein [Kiloniellaceae bacterium]|nr:DUF1127 domain-containing protein [Kiloniellaceae bacterium]
MDTILKPPVSPGRLGRPASDHQGRLGRSRCTAEALPDPRSGPGSGIVVQSWLMRALDVLALWQERAAGRAHLAQMDDRMLKDMGIGRAEADREAYKPFWRP